MQVVLIDQFIVPDKSKEAFLNQAMQIQSLVKNLPGHIEGFIYEKIQGDGRYNYITVAVWKDEASFLNARKTVAEEFKRKNFNPSEFFKLLGVQAERALYSRKSFEQK